MGKFLISLGAAGIAATLIAFALPQEIFVEASRPAAPKATAKSGQPHPQQPKAMTLPPLQGPF